MRPKPVSDPARQVHGWDQDRCCCGAKTDAVRFKNQAGIKRESEFVFAPVLQRLYDQRGVHVLCGNVFVRQPTAKSAFSALCSSGLGLNAWNPIGWIARSSLD